MTAPPTPFLPVLALCPLLAVSDTVVNALGIGIMAFVAVTASSVMATLIARRLPQEIRTVISVLILAGVVGCLMLLLNAWFHELHRSLGLFLPLLIANYVILNRIEAASAPAPQRPIAAAVKDGLTTAGALLALGMARELVGRGSLLHEAGLLLGNTAQRFDLQFFRADMGFLLATLPPGAFISFGLLLAARNWWIAKRSGPKSGPVVG